MNIQTRPVFWGEFKGSLERDTFVRFLLFPIQNTESDLISIKIRRVLVKGKSMISVLQKHKTREISKTLTEEMASALIQQHIKTGCREARLFTTEADIRWDLVSKPQAPFRTKPTFKNKPSLSHDRTKIRILKSSSPVWGKLGLSDEKGHVFPSMSHKWKQINKFMEIFAHSWEKTSKQIKDPVRVSDYGAGKGYLTFAVHQYLKEIEGRQVYVKGIDIRLDLVEYCNRVVGELGLQGLSFQVNESNPIQDKPIDVLLALHACDTATDEAISLAVRQKTFIIICSPCCHKEIRSQIVTPKELMSVMKYGIHAGQMAEMVTDTLRALFLETHGYVVNVIEFISPEHTHKNKMILAHRHESPSRMIRAQDEYQQIKSHFGITKMTLDSSL